MSDFLGIIENAYRVHRMDMFCPAREYKNQIPPEARSWVGLPGIVIAKCSNLVMFHGK